jgi:transposase
MQHRQTPHFLRELSDEEQAGLENLSRSNAAAAAWVERAKALLWVQRGASYSEAGRRIGRTNGDGVSALVKRFNQEGLSAVCPRHGGGYHKYTDADRARVLSEARRTPCVEQDGTTQWSLTTLQKALRQAPDGLPEVSTETIGRVLHEAGYSWQADRSWCQTGQVQRQRQAGIVTVTDPDTEAKKSH